MSIEYRVVDQIGHPPWDCVAKVYMKKWRSSYGSGVLISERHVLTAAHNVFYGSRWKRFRNGRVVLNHGHSELQKKSSLFYKNNIRWLSGYRNNLYSRDLALVTLPEPINTQSFSFRLPEIGEVSRLVSGGYELFVAGYPGMDKDLRVNHGGNTLKVASSINCQVDDKLIRYDINTAKGNSGGPVWFEVDGEFILAGIHVAEEIEGGDRNVLDAKAVMLDGDALLEVTEWMA